MEAIQSSGSRTVKVERDYMNSLFDNDGGQQQPQQQQYPPQQSQGGYQNQGNYPQQGNYQGGGQQQYGNHSYHQPQSPNAGPRLVEQGRMPFGKHRGMLVCEIPVDYLVWLYWKRQGNPLSAALRQLVIDAIRRHNLDPFGPMPAHFDQRPQNSGWNNQTNNAYQQNQGQQNSGGD